MIIQETSGGQHNDQTKEKPPGVEGSRMFIFHTMLFILSCDV
jgi:hypothetical protein